MKEEIRVGNNINGEFSRLIKIIVHYLELYHRFDIIKA